MKFLLFAAVCALASVSFVKADDDEVEQTNKFIDQILSQFMGKMDPMKLHKDYEVNIKNELGHLIEIFDGHIKLKSTIVHGLANISRVGNVKLDNVNDSMIASLEVKAHPISADTTLAIRVGLLPLPDTPISAQIGTVKMFISMGLTADGGLVLKKLELDEISEVKIDLKQFPFLDPFVNIITEAVLVIFNKMIRHIITDTMYPILENELKYVHIGG